MILSLKNSLIYFDHSSNPPCFSSLVRFYNISTESLFLFPPILMSLKMDPISQVWKPSNWWIGRLQTIEFSFWWLIRLSLCCKEEIMHILSQSSINTAKKTPLKPFDAHLNRLLVRRMQPKSSLHRDLYQYLSFLPILCLFEFRHSIKYFEYIIPIISLTPNSQLLPFHSLL